MMPVLALDFDGVLCDSVDETGTSGWKAGGTIWPDMLAEQPPAKILAGFRLARPVIETGYEAIVLMRLLLDGERPEILLDTYPERAPAVMARSGHDISELKARFAAARDRWRMAGPDEWVAASPLYAGIADWMHATPAVADRYIVTTKERRFVEHLLVGNGIAFPTGRIFGLEQGKPKEEVLCHLAERHPRQTVCFVEDRLATLERCQSHHRLSRLTLRLAGWGYNTEAERQKALASSIPVLERAGLFRFFEQESHLDQ